MHDRVQPSVLKKAVGNARCEGRGVSRGGDMTAGDEKRSKTLSDQGEEGRAGKKKWRVLIKQDQKHPS